MFILNNDFMVLLQFKKLKSHLLIALIGRDVNSNTKEMRGKHYKVFELKKQKS